MRLEVVLRSCQGAGGAALIGEVRGLGAMVAMELVTNRQTREPAGEQTDAILHRCHEAGLIIIKAGLSDNVIRVLVSLVIGDEHLAEGLDILEREVAAEQATL